MAPSFDIGTPQRSLVRIPGSGQDKSLKPICLDVAQIKHFSISLSTIVNFNFNAPPEQALGGTLNISPINSSTTTNTREQVSYSSQGQREHGAKDNNQGQGSGPSRKRSADEEQSQNTKKRPVASMSDSSILRNINLTLQERVQKMKELKEEEKKLREENEELSKKVAMFKDILRSRSKLKEFLRALEEMSC